MSWSKDEKLDFKKKMEQRTKKFSVSVFKYLDILPNSNSSRIIAFQLGKSASSVGANYREANRCESADDFIHKIGIALKECSESMYWLDVLRDLRPASENVDRLYKECEEILKILQSARSKLVARKA